MSDISLFTPTLVEPIRAKIGDPPNKLIIACVWWGDKYGEDYVIKLRNSIARNLTIPYEIVCITDKEEVPDGIIRIPTKTTNDGWWQKVSLFESGLFRDDSRILYLDLDIVITNSLLPIVSSQGDMIMIENFGPNKKHAAFNSSCMLWTPNEKTKKIYSCFSEKVINNLHGDQCWIWRVLQNDILTFEKDLAESYKYNTRTKQWRRSSDRTAIWVFHGKPDPHEVKDKFVIDHWK